MNFDHLEEEVAKTMAETMEQYMSKTRTDYGSGVARPNIKGKDHFELNGQFLKEHRGNTFSGLNHEDVKEHIEKVLEIVDLFHVPNISEDQLMLRVFLTSLTRAACRWLRNEPTGSIKQVLPTCPNCEENGGNQQLLARTRRNPLSSLGALSRTLDEILDSRGAIPSKTTADAKLAIQEMAEYSQKWHNGTSRTRSTETSNGLAAIEAQLNNLGREIKKVNEKFYAAQVGCEQCKRPHYTKYCPLKEEGKTLEEAYYT
uniref:Eukaryotic translation initiation factor 3 subunit G N-terminal domain-containing protein n=1 Tax=Tanacetum cinerariifolium TaxID=118510 RepID=A0A699IN20_TANCI|nr:hypothetical protein [Tanacetum cinerariifolium]